MKMMLRNDRIGSLLVNSVILMLVLLMTGVAFLKWTSDEGYQARFDLARTQAYYIAQRGALERGLAELRSRTAVELPNVLMTLPNGGEGEYGEFRGYYKDCTLTPVWSVLNENMSIDDDALIEEYVVSATGVVKFRQPNGEVEDVERSFNLTATKPSLSKYFYFTIDENTQYDEVIWFFGRDVLYGPVRSNDFIAMQGRPEFFMSVTTSMPNFIEGAGYNPIFHADTLFNAPEVLFENKANELRAGAQALGTYFDNRDGLWTTRIEGDALGWHVMQWDAGTPFDEENLNNDVRISYAQNRAIFVEGNLELKGEQISGRTSIGCEGDMRLIDDVTYEGFTPHSLDEANQANIYYLVGTDPILGLIGEQNIVIANTDANGKGNGANEGAWTDHSNKHIVIQAALIALGDESTGRGSVTFENQNNRPDDPNGWDGYWWCDPEGDHAGEQDERGAIYLRGVILMRQRGYVHRGANNCGGTGYDKEYAYDIRMWKTPPPHFPKERLDGDRYEFYISSSWDQDPERRNDFY
ncbi:hypothetical protein KQI63_15115 [bacterium]|nr:hypothetical protein [bacterium]